MVQETSGEDRAIEKIMTVFDGPSVEPFERRVRVLYNLAKDCKMGEIVELGTHHGYGAFALAYGLQDQELPVVQACIFTVDEYTEKKGWAGEPYSHDDFSIFIEKRRKLKLQSKVVLIIRDAKDGGNTHFNDGEIGLLYIDTGLNVREIFDAWKDKVMDGGIVAFRDTLTRSLKCDKIAADAVLSGKFAMLESPDDYFILIKRVA